MIMVVYITLIAGFVILIKSADLLVEGASSMAKFLGVSDMAIALTVVAFGTSAPELFVNIVSSIGKNSDMAIGNVLGSNVTNILLVLGVCAVYRPLKVGSGTVWREIPFVFFAAVCLGIMLNTGILRGAGYSVLSRVDALILLLFFAGFMKYAFSAAGRTGVIPEKIPEKRRSRLVSLFFIVLGLAGLCWGAALIVKSAVKIAVAMGVSEIFIGLTVVALGTSLPELATSVVAAHKGRFEIAVGNVVGSNIFNILLIAGISGMINPIIFNAKNNVSVLAMIMSSMLLFVSMFTRKKHSIGRMEGMVFVMLYVGFILLLIMRGILPTGG